MLHRAASNAYSWWWASHIRTKQSKWLDQSLQDMEHKVANVLKLIEEDGDSFARRAEMYYKKRPELINFVEESYRAYRALAERYDHISTELQNANNTIASCFPDQVPFMEEDDDDALPRTPRKMPEGFKQNIPKVPKAPQKEWKSVTTTATKKFGTKKTAAASVHIPNIPKSGLSKEELRVEIDKIQKQILTLQTVKEFVKSSYDNAIAKYWETEEQIKELQERVSILQDEFGEGIVIEDDEARRLMAEAALKSCQETLAQLQEKQEKSVSETRISNKRIKETREKLEAPMNKFNYDQSNQTEPRARRTWKGVEEKKGVDHDGEDRMSQQRQQELQLLQEKIKQHFDASSYSSMSVSEMAEKIDELVNKVVSLETAVSSQTALVNRLRTETDELQTQIRTLEDDKASLMNDKTDLNKKLREMEEKMYGVQDLNQMVEDQNTNLLTHFTEAQCNLDHLSETVQHVKADEDIEVKDLSQTKEKSSGEAKPEYGIEAQEALNKKDGFSLVNDGKSDKELKVTSLVESDGKLDNEINVSSLVENDMKSDKETKVNMKTENDVESDMEIQISDWGQNDVKTDKEPKVTSMTENDVKSDKDPKVTASLETEEASTAENKQSTELKQQEKALNPGKIDEISRDTLSATAGNQDVSQPGANKQADSSLESSRNPQYDDAKQISLEENTVEVHSEKKEANQEDEPDWRQLFMDGMKDREKVLLMEYTNTLRCYKDVKKQLTEVEKTNQNSLSDISLLLEELRASNALKDEELKLLRQKLSLLQQSLQGNEGLAELKVSVLPEQNQDIEAMLKTAQPETSAIEERFRANIDEILEENLEFWLKFSTTFNEIQKFETTIRDLQTDVLNLADKGKSSEGSASIKYNLKSDARPIYKHLSEIQAELTVWLEKSILLKEDLKRRFSSLCNIQEEITKALRDSAEDDEFKFTSYQAAKFQGEVLNMKQENNKVADELQAGLDLVTGLQLEVEKALANLNEQFELSKRQEGQVRHSESRNRVPLRSFIFGVKPKKQHRSIFSCMTPGIHRKHRGSRGQSYV